MSHLEVGKIGEQMAQEYLSQNKYKILFCNYSHKGLELDIVAQKKKTICFIEVKTRKYRSFKQEKDLTTLPEEKLTKKKKSNFLKAVQMFLLKNSLYENFDLQFSLLAIYLFDNHSPVINFYENILE